MDIKQLVIDWNNQNPLDRLFRIKNHIVFNSPQHRQTNQLDILFEYIEEKMFEQQQQQITEQAIKDEQYQKGIWLKENKLSNEQQQDLFDKIDVGSINSQDNSLSIQ